MKKMKIITLATVIAILMTCFTACSDKENAGDKEAAVTTTVTFESETEVIDETTTPETTTNTTALTSENGDNVSTSASQTVKSSEANSSVKATSKSSTKSATVKTTKATKATTKKANSTPKTTTKKANSTTVKTTTKKTSNPLTDGYWVNKYGYTHTLPDYNNKYMKKIYDSGLINSSVYKGTSIVRVKEKNADGWAICFMGNGVNSSATTYDLGFDTCKLSSKTMSYIESTIEKEGKINRDKILNFSLPFIDLDEDGFMDFSELEVISAIMSKSYNLKGYLFISSSRSISSTITVTHHSIVVG